MYLVCYISGQEDLLEDKLRLRGLVGCYALFQYLTVSIHAANAVYSQARERMEQLHCSLTPENGLNTKANLAHAEESHSAVDSSHTEKHCVNRLASECEVLAVQQAALLRYNNSISVFPLVTLRQTLTSALSAWSNSAPLWSIYIQASHDLLRNLKFKYQYIILLIIVG